MKLYQGSLSSNYYSEGGLVKAQVHPSWGL